MLRKVLCSDSWTCWFWTHENSALWVEGSHQLPFVETKPRVFWVSWLTLESMALAFNSSCSNNPVLCFVNIQEKKSKDCLNKVSDFAFSENWVAVKLLLQQFSNSSKIFFSPSDLSYYFWAAVWPRTWWCSELDHPFPVFSSVGDILSWVECSRMCWFGRKSGDSTGKDSRALFKLIQH